MRYRWFTAAPTALLGVLLLAGVSRAAPPGDEELKETALKLNSLTSIDAMNARLKELNKDKEVAKKLVAVSAKLIKDAGEKEAPFKYNAALVLGRLARNVKDLPAAEAFYGFCFDNAEKLQSGKKMLDAYESLLEIYWEQKKYEKAEELTKKLLDGGSKDIEDAQPFIMEKLILTKSKGGEMDEAIRMVDGIINLDKGGWYFVRLKAEVYREGGKLEEAIEGYLEAIERLEKNKKLNKELRKTYGTGMRYLLTGLYVDNKQVDKSIELLEKLMKAEPENGTYYNDLGYVMADNDMKLDEAEKLVRKAIDLDAAERKKLLEEEKITEEIAKKENAAYLDSLGWVFYKQGKFEEAYKYLDKASQDPDQGNHIEIWDHVADCLVKLGKKKEAVEVWTKALKLEDASKRDTERRKKVEDKLKKLKVELSK